MAQRLPWRTYPISEMSIFSEMSAKYIWWKGGDGRPFGARRVLAQVMDIGDYDDVLRVLDDVGEEPLRDVLAHAEPGWFKPRSWSYWHYRLGVVTPGAPVPDLPKRALP
jgi:hypothetical protein